MDDPLDTVAFGGAAGLLRLLHAAAVAALLLLPGCADTSGDPDGGAQDSGTQDAGCVDAPSGGESDCVMDQCAGYFVCVNGPCGYGCCVDGLETTCDLADGSECLVPTYLPCGSGTCVNEGESCP